MSDHRNLLNATHFVRYRTHRDIFFIYVPMFDAEQSYGRYARTLVLRNQLKGISNVRNHCFSTLNFDVIGRHSCVATQ
jgi:hypothetical protein